TRIIPITNFMATEISHIGYLFLSSCTQATAYKTMDTLKIQAQSSRLQHRSIEGRRTIRIPVGMGNT
ncbi:MAG: hypothetical protein R3E64_18895, partial [Halioglobus sp.]